MRDAVNYIVFDLEWNQAKNRNWRVQSPINLDGEIIQIGAVKLNEKLEEIDDFDVKVKPVFYPKMNKEVEKLTGITDDDLKDCPGFEDAVKRFREWCVVQPTVTPPPPDTPTDPPSDS